MYDSVAFSNDEGSVTDTFIMSLGRFARLSMVRGFNTLNGDTYQEHVAMMVKDRVSSEIHQQVLDSDTAGGALKVLRDNGVAYEHEDMV